MTRHYIEAEDMTIEWLGGRHLPFSAVMEYNTWKGRDVPDEAEVEHTRHTVLMECDHDAILRVSELLVAGDRRALKALQTTRALSAHPDTQAILGYCFKNNEPRVIVTWS